MINLERSDEEIQQFKEKSSRKELPRFCINEQGKLWYEDRICVLKDEALRRLILDEARHSAYSIHPGSTKMYMDLRQKILVDRNERKYRRVFRPMRYL
jgi:hypothetical protein